MSVHNQRKTLLSGLWIQNWEFTEIIDVSVAFVTQKTFIYQKTWSTVKRDFNAFSVSLPWLHIFSYNSDPVEKVSLSHCSTHTSFLPVMTIYVSSMTCCTNFHTALSQNLPLPCLRGTREKDNNSFRFSASHQEHESPQNSSGRITLKPGLWGKCCFCFALCSPAVHFSVLAENATALNLYLEDFNVDPPHCPNPAIFLHWRHTIHKLCTTDFCTPNVWIGQRQRRWESLVNLD